MPGRQAKILNDAIFDDLLHYAATTRNPHRNRVIVLLSVKAGLRAAEIAQLTWAMLIEPSGSIGSCLELHDAAAKKRHGRCIPLHADLQTALEQLAKPERRHGPVIRSERGHAMTPLSIVVWFNRAYRLIDAKGCSSHSGRRTFVTRAARLAHRAGGSLRDVQLLAGHRSIQTTQRYIEGDSDVQRTLVSLL